LSNTPKRVRFVKSPVLTYDAIISIIIIIRSLCSSRVGAGRTYVSINIGIRISKPCVLMFNGYAYIAVMASGDMAGISISERLSANQQALYA